MTDESIELEFKQMETTMKNALASRHLLTQEQAKALGIGEAFFWDIKNRLIRQGIKIDFADHTGNVIQIARRSQIKLLEQGYCLCDMRD